MSFVDITSARPPVFPPLKDDGRSISNGKDLVVIHNHGHVIGIPEGDDRHNSHAQFVGIFGGGRRAIINRHGGVMTVSDCNIPIYLILNMVPVRLCDWFRGYPNHKLDFRDYG